MQSGIAGGGGSTEKQSPTLLKGLLADANLQQKNALKHHYSGQSVNNYAASVSFDNQVLLGSPQKPGVGNPNIGGAAHPNHLYH